MKYAFDDNGQRRTALSDARRIVIKVGTRLLTDVAGMSEAERVDQLVAEATDLRNRGKEVILVSSGAIGAGMAVLGASDRPKTIPQLQAHAAVGQCRLMSLYESACAARGFHCAQLLLTAADVNDRERHLNVTSCVNALLSHGILPIINENDSVSVDEIRFGDNDALAGMVSAMLRADLTVLLTTVDGLRQPEAGGRRVSVVESIDEQVMSWAGGTDGNRFSTGGMITKLRAAAMVTRAGEHLWIGDGTDFGVLRRISDGEDTGTLFCPRQGPRMRGHKRFLAFFSEPAGVLTVDAGAQRAICRDGRSLLPSGVVGVEGTFGRGDTVRIVTTEGEEVARGVANYAASEVCRIQGVKSAEVGAILGIDACFEEVVHRDYMALTG